VQFEKGEKIYEGKAKVIFNVLNNKNLVRQSFKDSLTAFNGEKKGSFALKGSLNRDISSIIFRFLKKPWGAQPLGGRSKCLRHDHR